RKPWPSPKSQLHSVAPAAATWNWTVPAENGSLVGANRLGSGERAPRVKSALFVAEVVLDTVSVAVKSPASVPTVFQVKLGLALEVTGEPPGRVVICQL